MHDLSDYWIFLITFGSLAAAGIGAPIPEEIPTIGAGVWVGANAEFGPTRWLIFPVCVLGVLISDVLLYGIGRRWGTRLLEHRWVSRWLSPESRQRTERNFQEYGVKILLLVRWLPGIRSPMFVTAGVMRLPLYLFVLADGIAALFGHAILFFLGYWFGEQFQVLFVRAEHTFAATFKAVLILCGVGALAAYLIYHFWRRPVSTGDPKEVPLIGDKVADKLSSTDLHVAPDPRAKEVSRSSEG